MYKTEARLKIKKAFSASTRCEEKTIEISSIIGLENYLKKFNSIASYSSIAYEFPSGEVNKWILNKKKKLLLPKIDSQKKKIDFYVCDSLTRMKKNKFGISEPLNKNLCNDFELAIIPMMGFNSNLKRLGRGGGLYDQFFKEKGSLKIGIAYSFQQIKFHEEDHDLKYDRVFMI